MNRLDFTVKQGFPWSESAVEFMQNMMLQLQYGSLLGGANYILNGCLDSNGSVGNGIVVVNGEILPFTGGPVQDKVIVVDTPTKKQFFGGAQNDYYRDRIATFGSGGEEYVWADFKRNDPANGVLARLDKLEMMLKPLIGYTAVVDNVQTTVYGSWLFWGRPANEIPAGWEPVPDSEWKGKVPVVFDAAQAEFDEVGKTGGAKAVGLTTGQLPAHFLYTVTNNDGTDANLLDSSTKSIAKKGNFGNNGDYALATGAGTPTIGKTSSVGNNEMHPNLQPYRVVMFIRFKG